jgi:hypothetical protein
VTRTYLGTFALAVLCLLPRHASAAGDAKACEADRQKFCADVKIGGGRVVACLQRHESELSSACKQQLDELTRGGPGIPECRPDAMKLCRDSIGDPAKVKACLQTHTAELSEGCKKALDTQGK